MDDEDGLSDFESLTDDLRTRARTARENNQRDISDQCFKAELVLDQYRIDLRKARESHRRKLTSACISRPGQKSFSLPQVKTPILYKDNQPVTKLFIYNIKDKVLTRERLTELFSAQGLKDFHLSKVNCISGTTVFSCEKLETSCKLQF